MDEFRHISRIVQHPAGRSGLIIGFLIGFVTVLMSGIGKTLLYLGMLASWQFIWRFCGLFLKHGRSDT
ncbi:MAG TPA: hypothetical protein VKV20_05950 [Ktedonobacteraceae bacterium]|nr:hypothetical protein [Ktedonobacteraceae bacterium]